MARVPQDEIDRIKREVSIERLVEAHGVELKAHGKDRIGLCPFHNDTSPSLVITPEKNLWHCLGKCNAGGSVIDWVIRAQGVSYRHAIEILRADQMPAAPARPVKNSSVVKLASPVTFSSDDHTLMREVITYYHHALKNCPEALGYLKTRGIASPELIERFHIGFANRTLGLRLPDKNRKAGGEVRARLQKIGILAESGHERLNGSLVIPVLDEQGRVLELYGRKITPNLRTGTPDHLYLPGPRETRGVFNIEAVARYPEMILCEALIDALTFLAAGFPNITSSYGVNGFTDDHLAALRRFKTKRVLIAYDRDDAGDAAAEKLAPVLMAAGIECFRIQFPRGMDANEYALKVQPAAKSLGLAIRKALWMGKGPAPVRSDDAPLVIAPPQTAGPAAPPAPTRAAVPAAPVHPPRPEAVVPRPPAPASPALPVSPPPTLAPVASSAPPLAAAPQPPAPLAETAPVAAGTPPPASPVPSRPVPPPVERAGQELRIVLGDRQYRIRGLEKNVDVDHLKVNVLVTRAAGFHVETLDLYLTRPRIAFSREASLELGVSEDVVRNDLGRVLLALEAIQDEQRQAAVTPQTSEVTMTPAEREEALELLRDPRLLDRILDDFRACGIAGEETNKLVGFLAGVSRKDSRPLAVVIQSSSAAGKSSLMEAILAFIPEEERTQYSAMTGQSLFYMGNAELKHKVLAIAEEEGAERASYALKLLQSEGKLSIASTGKDPATGRHVTHEYHVEGPVMIFLTTTAVDIDEELLNRCIVLTVNEDREQTRLIHGMQRAGQTLAGQLAGRNTSKIIERHQNAQRLLRPLVVSNEYGPLLTFRDDQTRTRRDHGKYLTLIRTVALLHQHQRPVRTMTHEGETVEYVDVTREDIRVANRLANDVLGRTLDELPPQTRRLLVQLHAWVTAECERLGMVQADFRFQRADVRALGWGLTQARGHIEKLVDFEYVVVHRGTRGQTFVYELVYEGEGQDGQRFLMGLIDPDTLPAECGYDGKLAGAEAELAGGWRPQSGPISGSWRGASDDCAAASHQASDANLAANVNFTVPEPESGKTPSYPHGVTGGPRRVNGGSAA